MKTLRQLLQRAVLLAALGLALPVLGQTTTDGTDTTSDTTTDTTDDASTTTGGTTTTGTGTTPATNNTATGVFIYKLKFEHIEGINVDFWGGGYVIVPSLGGTGSAILTANDRGTRTYSEQSNTVAFYYGKSDGKRYSIVSMGGGSVGGNDPMLSMQAFGEVKHPLQINGPGYTLRVQAAKNLHGMAQAARNESTLAVAEQPKDGTLSFVEFSEMKLVLDEDQTAKANKNGGTVSTAQAQMLLVVKQQGYVAEGATDDDDDDGGTGGGGGSGGGGTGGGTTNPPIDTGGGGTVNP